MDVKVESEIRHCGTCALRFTMRYLWMILSAVLCMAARSESIEVQNLRVINLSELGLHGKIERVRLSPDARFASVEIKHGLSRFLYIVNLRKRQAQPVDPRTELSMYQVWKHSPYRYLFTVEDGEADWYPRLVRGEQWLCFTSNGVEDKRDLYLYNVDRNLVLRLTATNESERFPRWSPDGKSLAFVRTSRRGNELRFFPRADIIFRKVEDYLFRHRFVSAFTMSPFARCFDRELVVVKKSRRPILFYWSGSKPVAASKTRNVRRELDEGGLNWSNQHSTLLFAGSDASAYILGLEGTRIKSYKTKRPYAVRQLMFPAAFVGRNTIIGRSQSSANLVLVTGIREKPVVIPLEFKTPYRDELGRTCSIDAQRTIVEGKGNYDILLGFGGEEEEYIMSGSIKPEDIGENVRTNVLVNIGFSGGFAKYTGDAGNGDFLPVGGFWVESQPLPNSAPALSLGVEFNYVELSGRTRTDKKFKRKLLHGSMYLQAGYLFRYTYRPFVRASLGRAVLDKRRSDGSYQQTTIYGFGVGMEFVVTPSMQVRLYGEFQYSKNDLDMVMQVPKADSFGQIMIGMNYTLPF